MVDKELIRYLKDLKVLRGMPEFKRFMYGNFQAIDSLNEKLLLAEPTEPVVIARIQGELGFRKQMQKEYEDCEKLIFELEMRKKSDTTDHQVGGSAPPKE